MSNFRGANIGFDGYPETVNTTDNTHKRLLTFKGKKNVFVRNNSNKHRVINVTMTELIKPGCNVFHQYYDAAVVSKS